MQTKRSYRDRYLAGGLLVVLSLCSLDVDEDQNVLNTDVVHEDMVCTRQQPCCVCSQGIGGNDIRVHLEETWDELRQQGSITQVHILSY